MSVGTPGDSVLVVIGDLCYVTSNDAETPHCHPLLEGMFPELSTNQLKVCVFTQWVFLTTPLLRTVGFLETVRTCLEASLKNLNLEGYDALRSAVLMQNFSFS